MRPSADVQAGVALVRTAKEVLPAGWPMFLVWEYGLEELLPYLPDPAVILNTGLQWQRIKGTPDSVVIALSWLDLVAITEEETPTGRHWYEYQIDPGTAPSRSELRNIVGLARLSAPVGTRLARLFHGYDRRRAIYDEVSWSDGTLWSDYSGIYDQELDVRLSFGVNNASAASLGSPLMAWSHTLSVLTVTPYVDRALWDFVSWGDGPSLLNYQMLVLTQHESAAEPITDTFQPETVTVTRSLAYEQYSWGEANWGSRTWSDPAP